MFGGHGGGLGHLAQAPGISETVINNYYGNEPGTGADAPMQHAAWSEDNAAPDAGADPGLQYAADQDPGYDAEQDYAADEDFGDDSDYA
jgi:hypothetical protein